jgi:hypothetical protein
LASQNGKRLSKDLDQMKEALDTVDSYALRGGLSLFDASRLPRTRGYIWWVAHSTRYRCMVCLRTASQPVATV